MQTKTLANCCESTLGLRQAPDGLLSTNTEQDFYVVELGVIRKATSRSLIRNLCGRWLSPIRLSLLDRLD